MGRTVLDAGARIAVEAGRRDVVATAEGLRRTLGRLVAPGVNVVAV